MNWTGVMPAMTTCFDGRLGVDHIFMANHARWMLDNGCTGIVALGSLGEAATLTFQEKTDILTSLVRSLNGHAPVIAGIAALSTADAVALAERSTDVGCDGVMVLPPYVYQSDWREMKAYISAVLRATPLSAMLYNNPVAYGTDFLPAQIGDLAQEHENLQAIKESSTDVRRVTAIRELIGDRLRIFVGVDDAIVEAVAVGATGWIAGLVNAFPRESVVLFEHARDGRMSEAFDLYRWFLPLLRTDTVPKFVQLIKLAQQELGVGNTRVRGPRLELDGEELTVARAVIREALRTRPSVPQVPVPATLASAS